MNLYNSALYWEDVRSTAALELPWNALGGRKLLLSGATGLVGSFLVDVVQCKNLEELDCTVYALGRSPERALSRFGRWAGNPLLQFIPYDVNRPLQLEDLGQVDYVLHLASNTHPMQYATDPIGTITTNIIGLQNLLEFATDHQARRFAFASSNEVYGENRGDAETFAEDYCGYLNCNTLRAGYPESKRCGEALCQAYLHQKGLDVVIPRLTRSYGPTMLMTDTKAISQFLRKGIAGEDIVLKSTGQQYYSYTYVADAVAGLLTVLLKGQSSQAYNIADESSDIRLRDLAAIIAAQAGKQVVFEIPDEVERSGYSTATKARLDGTKLKNLGWSLRYDIPTGVAHTMDILSGMG